MPYGNLRIWFIQLLIPKVIFAQGVRMEVRKLFSFTSNGTERWRSPIQGATSVNIQFIDKQGRVYLTDNNRKLHSIDTSTGSITWSFQSDSNLLWAILAPGGKIFMQDDQSTFYWLDTTLDYAQSSWPVAMYGNRRHTMKAWDNLPLPLYMREVLNYPEPVRLDAGILMVRRYPVPVQDKMGTFRPG